MLTAEQILSIAEELQNAIRPLQRDKAIIDTFISKPDRLELSANNFSLNLSEQHLPALQAFLKSVSNDYQHQIDLAVTIANKQLMEANNAKYKTQDQREEVGTAPHLGI